MVDKTLHGSWKQDGDRGRGQFADIQGDTSQDRKTTTELPAGYSPLEINGGTDNWFDAARSGGSGYDGIPEQM
jgi:hypothetical protein